MTRAEWVVYRLYAADGELIYIGCTHDVEARISHHRHVKPWWHEVARIDVSEAHADKRSGWAAERAAIVAAQPRYNVNYVGGGLELPECDGGSYAGYGRHRYRGETPCDACQAAKADYVRARRASA